MAEAKGHAFLFQCDKVIRMVEPAHRKMLFSRLEILPDGHDIAPGGTDVTHHFPCFFERFPHPDDQARFRTRTEAFGAVQEIEGTIVFPLWPNGWKQATDRLNVVIHNVRLNFHYNSQGIVIT